MKYLLDTNVLLILFANPNQIRKSVLEAIADPVNDLFVSAVSAWEIAIKHAIGKLTLPGEPFAYIAQRMQALQMRQLPITFDHAFAVGRLPFHHTDPFDRLLVAQAQVEVMTIVTTDRQISRYEVPTLRG